MGLFDAGTVQAENRERVNSSVPNPTAIDIPTTPSDPALALDTTASVPLLSPTEPSPFPRRPSFCSLGFTPKVLTSKTDAELRTNLASEYNEIIMRYNAAKSVLYGQLKPYIDGENEQEHDEAALKRITEAAKAVFETGVQLYVNYLTMGQPEEKAKVAKELYHCEVLLGKENPRWKVYVDKVCHEESVRLSSIIRSYTSQSNWYRLFLLRLKKMCATLMPLMKSVAYQNFIQQIETINPILNYLAWLFFLPRLTINLIGLFQQMILGWWGTKQERALAVRLSVQWGEVWTEVLNDIVWFAFGIANCFFLTLTASMGIAVGLYFFDVMIAYIKAGLNMAYHHELLQNIEKKLNVLGDEIKRLHKVGCPSLEALETKLALCTTYRSNIERWCKFERQQLELSIQVKCGLAICMSLSILPILFTLSLPVSALFSAISATGMVIMCIYDYYQKKQVEKLRPAAIEQALQKFETSFLVNEENVAKTNKSSLPSFFHRRPNNSSPFTPSKKAPSIDHIPRALAHARGISLPLASIHSRCASWLPEDLLPENSDDDASIPNLGATTL